jgi:hypothetical protein
VNSTAPRGELAAPAPDFLQALAARMFKQPHAMAGVFKLVNVGPYFGLPRLVVGGGFAAGGASGMQADGRYRRGQGYSRSRQFEKDAANFANLLAVIEDMFVAEQVTKSQLAGFSFSLDTGVKRAIFRPQLLGRVASHPESFYVHSCPAQGLRSQLEPACEPALMGRVCQCNFQADC